MSSRSKSEHQDTSDKPAASSDSPASKPLPQGGLNTELGDLDAAADADDEIEQDDDALPGRAGGGLIGG